MKISVYSKNGQKLSNIELEPKVFEQKINEGLVHQAVVAEMSCDRKGTASTKTRAEVRGGGIKPWRQKGTGRARAGSIRSPIFVGGGITFGPKPRKYKKKFPKKMRRAALRSVFSAKAKNNEIVIVDKLDIKEPKTNKAKEILDKLKIDKKSTVLIEKADMNIVKSFKNLKNVNLLTLSEVSVITILDNEKLLITKDVLKRLVEVLS